MTPPVGHPVNSDLFATSPPTVLHFTAPGTLMDSLGPGLYACSDAQGRKAYSRQVFTIYYVPQLPNRGDPSALPGGAAQRAAEWKRLTSWRKVALSWDGEPDSAQSFTMPDSVGYGTARVRVANGAGESQCESNYAPSRTP